MLVGVRSFTVDCTRRVLLQIRELLDQSLLLSTQLGRYAHFQVDVMVTCRHQKINMKTI